MRGGPSGRDDRCVRDTLESVGVPPGPLALPATLISRPPGLQVPDAAACSSPVLGWQSSIGQFHLARVDRV